MAWLETGKARFLSGFHTAEERLHRFIQSDIDLCQKLAIDVPQLTVILLARSQRLPGSLEVPAFPAAQAHDPPVVESPTLGLHELQGFSVLLADLNLDLLTQ